MTVVILLRMMVAVEVQIEAVVGQACKTVELDVVLLAEVIQERLTRYLLDREREVNVVMN